MAEYYGREVPNFAALGLMADQVYKVYRPGDELAKAAKTFEGLPLQLDHHFDSSVDPQKDARVGSLGTDAVYTAPYLDISLHITDQMAIDAINHGDFREISASYMYDPVIENGTFNGEPYQIRMRNIRGNHVALVREGRAGPDVAVADCKTVHGNTVKDGVPHMKKDRKSALARVFAACDAQICDLAVPVSALADAVAAALEGGEPEPAAAGATPADASIDEILAQYLGSASEEEKQAIKALLEKMRAEPAPADPVTVEPKDGEPAPAPAAEPAPVGEPKDSDPAPAADPVAVEPKDSEPAPAPAADANSIKAAVEAHYRGMVQAAQDCASILGHVDPLAFDGAEAIYRKALALRGFDASAVAADALPAMIKFVNQCGVVTAPAPVADSKPADNDAGAQALARIRIL